MYLIFFSSPIWTKLGTRDELNNLLSREFRKDSAVKDIHYFWV